VTTLRARAYDADGHGPAWPKSLLGRHVARRPRAKNWPATVPLFFSNFQISFFQFKISRKMCNLQKYIENGIQLRKIQNKFP
jgi:hypothetical protein